MDPDGFRLVRGQSVPSCEILYDENAYVSNKNRVLNGKVVIASAQCNRDAMWYEDIRKDAVLDI